MCSPEYYNGKKVIWARKEVVRGETTKEFKDCTPSTSLERLAYLQTEDTGHNISIGKTDIHITLPPALFQA